jgi:hypothetical protein
MSSIAGLESRTLQDLQGADFDPHPNDHDGLVSGQARREEDWLADSITHIIHAMTATLAAFKTTNDVMIFRGRMIFRGFVNSWFRKLGL